ncbi:MAG: hypothetical protein MUE90_01825 [Thermoanaerobaculales bacterium]|nr:hypothetical protein [Thermoanaerobaculales bacterium]
MNPNRSRRWCLALAVLAVGAASVPTALAGAAEDGLNGTWFFVRSFGVGAGVQRVDIRVREFEGDSYTARGSSSQIGALLCLEAAL